MSNRAVKIAEYFAIFLLICFEYYLLVYQGSQARLRDFSIYLEAGQRLRQDLPVYEFIYWRPSYVPGAPDLENYFFYPPPFAWIFSWLSTLTESTLRFAWCLANFIAAIGTSLILALLWNKAHSSFSFSRLFCIALFFVASFEPVFASILEGQVNIIILFLLSLFLLLAHRTSRFPASLILACATVIKASPILLVLGALRLRDIRAFLLFLSSTLGLLLLPVALGLNFDYYRSFVSRVFAVGKQEFFRDNAVNYAIAAALGRISPIFTSEITRMLVWGLIFGIGLYFLDRAARVKSFREERVYAVLICLITILSPVFWYHHLAWILAPLAVLGMIRFQSREEQYRFWAWGVAIFLLLSQTYLIQGLSAGLGISFLQPVMALMPTVILLLLMWVISSPTKTA